MERTNVEWMALKLLPAKFAYEVAEKRIQHLSPLLSNAKQRDGLVRAWDEGRESIHTFIERVEGYLASCRKQGVIAPIWANFIKEAEIAVNSCAKVLKASMVKLTYIEGTKKSDKFALSGDISSLYSLLSMLAVHVFRGIE